MKVEKGNKIKVDYEGRLDSGEVFDSSTHGDHSHPIEFIVGENQVIKGFDQGVIGMEINQEKEISIEPDQGYGQINPELMRDIPRSALPQDQEPKQGMALMMTSPTGQQVPARIAEVTDEKVVLDLNHPLAGKKIIFKVKIIEINPRE